MPRVWFPPVTPFTLQLTAVLAAPVTVAVNCAVAEVETVVVVGLTATVITGGATLVELVELAAAGAVPPHDVIKLIAAIANRRTTTAVPNFRTFIPSPQQSRDVRGATLVGRPHKKRLKALRRQVGFRNTPESRAVPATGTGLNAFARANAALQISVPKSTDLITA